MKHAFTIMLIVLLIAPAALALQIEGVLGMTDVQDRACIAVWMPLAENKAVAGVNWYNNDGSIVFPELLFSAGQVDDPGLLDDATVAVTGLSGSSDAWSSATLAEPVASEVDGLYMLFRLPSGSVQVARGEGGGAGLGYAVEPGGHAAWLSINGEEWVRLHESIKLGVEVVLSEAGATTLRLGRETGKSMLWSEPSDDTPTLVNAFHRPCPNPFNPKTTLRFTLRKAGKLSLDVYDLKGRRLALLAEGDWSAGDHEIEWNGRDRDDHPLASGAYLAHLKTEHYEATQRLMLVR